ncbi:hypothetical protein ABIA00_000170 [Bradyrhizobium ottawaense]
MKRTQRSRPTICVMPDRLERSRRSTRPGRPVALAAAMRSMFPSSFVAARLCVVFVTLASGAGFASAQATDPVEALGYHQSSEGRSLVQAALKSANAVLSSSSSFRLKPSWSLKDREARSPNDILVFNVATTAKPFVIQVPFQSCRCIFVQEAAFRKSVDRYARNSKKTSEIDPSELLAFMLLHEVGHQESGHPGFMDQESPDLNFDDNEIKARERAADEFAAKALVTASKDGGRVDAFLAAMKLEMALSKVSFNLSGLRIVDHFGGSTLCSKDLFADKGVSHPNFELRILVVNDIISGTATSRQLLTDFERCRPTGSR